MLVPSWQKAVGSDVLYSSDHPNFFSPSDEKTPCNPVRLSAMLDPWHNVLGLSKGQLKTLYLPAALPLLK